jgi:hypothetical protein
VIDKTRYNMSIRHHITFHIQSDTGCSHHFLKNTLQGDTHKVSQSYYVSSRGNKKQDSIGVLQIKLIDTSLPRLVVYHTYQMQRYIIPLYRAKTISSVAQGNGRGQDPCIHSYRDCTADTVHLVLFNIVKQYRYDRTRYFE